MEDEIQVREYVRTKTGRIYKLSYYSKEEKRWICVTDEDWFPVYESEIVKHSFNIIDLIECGDYVNGCKVYENHKTYLTVHQKVKNSEVDYNYINHDEIKSIVTYQQFKSIEYTIYEREEKNNG